MDVPAMPKVPEGNSFKPEAIRLAIPTPGNPRKIIQIAIAHNGIVGSDGLALIALCNDGTIWEQDKGGRANTWHPLPKITQDTVEV